MQENTARVIVMVPAYNEAGRIGEVLEKLTRASYGVVVVDDGSSDATREIAARYPVYLLSHPFNLGQGAAIQTALTYALTLDKDIFVTFDADDQHLLEDIARVTDPIAQGRYDVVFGSRFKGHAINMPWLRKQCVRVLTLLYNALFRSKLSDINCGLRAFSRKAAEQIHITQNRMAHTLEIVEQVLDKNLAYGEVPITIEYTDYSLRKGQKLHGVWRVFCDWTMR